MSRRNCILVVLLVLVAALAAPGDVARWLADIDAGGRLETVFFRTVALPGGATAVRRVPQETVPELSRLIAAAPRDADLFARRASENEQLLDFAAAEADWKQHAETAPDRGAGLETLADFYARRVRPADQLRTLALAARENPPSGERWSPILQQRPSRIYEQMLGIIDAQQLPDEQAQRVFGEWMVRYPKEPALYRRALDFYAARKRPDAIADVANGYRRAFPADDVFPIEAAARAALAAGDLPRATATYDRALNAAASPALVKAYFDLLQQNNGLRAYFVAARGAAQANPRSLDAAARLYFYHQQQGRADAAHRVLVEFRDRREAANPQWPSAELATLARLFEGVQAAQDAARCYFALYQMSGADNSAAETGLGGLAELLLEAPDQPVRLGSGSLALLTDIATADTGPGFWNGILSVLLNAAPPAQQFESADQASPAYFRRAKAAELSLLFASRFPNSPRRRQLDARLIETYALYGESDAVIREGTRYLAAYPDDPRRSTVALEIAAAHVRKNQTREEFAVYEAQLRELAARADGVPLGLQEQERTDRGSAPAARSPEYARVLDRYTGRLAALKRTADALALYRRELDRNPNDPGLYERLAAFLEQNRLGAEVEQTYARALKQFPDISWRDKAARWYLRQKQTAQFTRLTQEVVAAFSGTELAGYFERMVSRGPVAPELYLQLNRYANQRFPHHPAFVRNLLAAYTTGTTADPAAYDRLLRANWWLAPDLRTTLLEHLTRTGKLGAELETLRASAWTPESAKANPGAARLWADGEAWRCHFETAAPALTALAAALPADPEIAGRAATVERSLGRIDASLALESKLSQAAPADAALLTRLGEIEAEREQFAKARGYWDRIPQLAPGRAEGYLETATVFWDYFQYDDALRTIGAARQKLARPDLFAYEAGAIHENRRDYPQAIREYARGALEGENPARARLLVLSRRPAHAAEIDRLSDNLVSGTNPPAGAVTLRVALLRETATRAALEKFLAGAVARATAPGTLVQLGDLARGEGLAAVERQSLERQAALTADPVEKLTARLAVVRLFEANGQPVDAARTMDAIYRENPRLAGIVRAAVDHHARNRNPRRAVEILLEAASAATPDRSRAYTLEAAHRATEAGEWQRGRDLLARLLAAEPHAPDLLTATADTYARAGDDRGLRQFYTGRIDALRSAPFPPAERATRIASLRRGLIPVLARLDDRAAAVDQYIEILNLYPEDEATAQEAARFAAQANLADRLRAPYEKALAGSPRDPRWPVVLARLDVALEDPAAAIAAYGRALAVRPDRIDLVLERARLAERLLRFAEAAAGYQQAYELAYRDPQWLEKVAEMRAREGKAEEAFTVLRPARLEGRADEPLAYHALATQLEAWGDFTRAREVIEQGLRLADNDSRGSLLLLRGRLAARQREMSTALADLPEGWESQILSGVGDTIAQYYTPEEKEKLAADLGRRARSNLYYDFFRRAGFLDLEAAWLRDDLLATPDEAPSKFLLANLSELQNSRGRFAELGQQVEAYFRAARPQQPALLLSAAEAYRRAGRENDEARMLLEAYQRTGLSGEPLERMCQAILAQPARLAALAGANRWPASENALVACAIERGAPAAAFPVIAARGARISPLWTRAYTALAGLYLASDQPVVRQSFADLLGPSTIGDHLGKPVDRQAQLAGADWFPFGARYADYLALLKQPEAADYRAALLEARPADPSAYLETGDAERSADAGRAAANYALALELDPNLAEAHDRLALLAAARGDRESALAAWRAALAAYDRQLDARRTSPMFGASLGATLDHLVDAKALDALRPEAGALLAKYVRRNGAFESAAVLSPLVRADAAAGAAWIIELAAEAPAPGAFLREVRDALYIPDTARAPLYQAVLERARARAAASFGEAKAIAESELRSDERAWILYLLASQQATRAAEAFASLPPDVREQETALGIRVAAAGGQLAAWIAAYERRGAPFDRDALRATATQLDPPNARRLLRWIYDGEIAAPNPPATSFLGAAEVRLDENDPSGALALLRRMTRATPDAAAHFGAAAALLETKGRAAEAAEFRELQLKATPWDTSARRALAVLRKDAAVLREVASSPGAPYADRVAAALALRGQPAADLGSAELNLLAAGPVNNAAAAERPFFVAARQEAAKSLPNLAVRLHGGVLALAPTNEHREALLDAALAARQDRLAAALGFQLWSQQYPVYGGQPVAPDARRADLLRRLAQVENRLGKLERARTLLQTARGMEPSGPARARDGDELRRLDRLLETRTENAARRPLVTNNITQDRVVRPRLGGAQ